MRFSSVMCFGLGVGTLFFVPVAQAGFTTVNGPAAHNKGHEGIIENFYGGDFTANGLSFSNGTINAERIADTGSSNDQLFKAGTFDAQTVASFAAANQSFGYFAGTNGGSFVDLFDVSGKGYGATGTASNVSVSGDQLRFARSGSTGTQTSQDSDNFDLRDHLISYQITGLSNQKDDVYLLFWEDLNVGRNLMPGKAATNYNDLVVQVSYTGAPTPGDGGTVAIPLPNASYAGFTMLGALGGLGLLRRRKLI
jgi:hypothetical protein